MGKKLVILVILFAVFYLPTIAYAMGETPSISIEEKEKLQKQAPPLQTPQDSYNYFGIRISSYEAWPRLYQMDADYTKKPKGIIFRASANEYVYWVVRVFTKAKMGHFGWDDVNSISGDIDGGSGKDMKVMWLVKEAYNRPIPSGDYEFAIIAWDKISGRYSSIHGPISLVRNETRGLNE